MIPAAEGRVRLGVLLAMAGLVFQTAASFFWSPAAFLISAGIGVPLVALGMLAVWTGLRRSTRSSSPGPGPSDGSAS